MSLALLVAAAWPALVTLPPRPHPLQPLCRRASPTLVAGPNAAKIHPLGAEPPAQQIRAVLRTNPDGCIVPMVVRAEVGQPRR